METDKRTGRHRQLIASSVNEHIQCGICDGYMIDATTISDCLHSFCKSCIISHITSMSQDARCPTCDSRLDDLKSCFKSDSALQRLIYKLVPNLLESELERRETFASSQENAASSYNHLNKSSVLNIRLFNTQNEMFFDASSSKMSSKENQLGTQLNRRTASGPKELKIKYIQCVAQTPIRILVKLLRNKYSIPLSYKVCIFLNN
jgi:hypothetical protein